ncbi:acyltransferase [Cohnella endophytica]|uniref:Acyltransferase n=1 Tax=Cohnella endophytica TaxID=2419778 RepID=A0A494XHB4_9BACL|nr:acyltransferase [Cohnella endophytica]
MKLDYLDVFRSIAILAVIMIHTTGYAVGALPKEDSLYPLYLILNSASHFSVPAFLFLSSLVHFYNYDGRTSIQWGTFYLKRILTVVVPYVVWSIIYFLLVTYNNGSSVEERLPDFFKNLLYGSNYTHLYFLVIMIQFFVLFPFMLWIARYKWVRSNLILIGILLQVAFYLGNYYEFHMTKIGTFVGSYFIYLFVGAYAGIRLQKTGSLVEKRHRKVILYILVIVLGAAHVTHVFLITYYPHYIGLPYRSWINFVTVYGFCALCSIALIPISAWLFKNGGVIANWLKGIGIASFGIYLVHPLVLFIWRNKIMSNFPNYFHLFVLGSGLAALFVSWLFAVLVRKSRLSSKVLLGER